MATYRNLNQGSAIDTVEFSPVPEGNYTFFHLKAGADDSELRAALGKLNQEIESETKLGSQTVLVTRGDRSQQDIVDILAKHGDTLEAPKAKREFHPWKIRGNLSMAGQIGQLTAGALIAKKLAGAELFNEREKYLNTAPPHSLSPGIVAEDIKNIEKSSLWKRKGVDKPLIVFATANILANLTNIVFGAEKSEDAHQLSYLKKKSNALLEQYVPAGSALPDVHDKRRALREEPAKPKSIGMKFHDFVKHNSVRIGEIGLRYIGALGLAFPYSQWKEAKDHFVKSKNATPLSAEEKGIKREEFTAAKSKLKELKTAPVPAGTISIEMQKDAVNAAKKEIQLLEHQLGKGTFLGASKSAIKTAFNKTDKLAGWVGVAYLAGKSIALFSKVPDPYNKEHKHTWVDTMREKYLFAGSSAMEGLAAGLLAYNSFANKKIIVKNKLVADFPGGIGGLLFTAGLGIRIFAKFGVKEVNMNELDAHISDSLALIPPDKLPEAVAKSAAMITEHFKEKHLQFAQVYSQITNDLYRYHNIALPGADGGNGVVAVAADAPEPTPAKAPFAKLELKKPDLASIPRPASYQDLAAASTGAARTI